MKIRHLIILPFVFLHLSLLADGNIKYLADGDASPKAKIDQVSWIAGNWEGEAFGGQTEEIWSKPSAGSMMAVFKLTKDNQVSFYEIEIIREVNNSLVLELKHFSKELEGWEDKKEKVSFPLVKLGENVVYFDGMTFKKISDDILHVFVDIEDKGKHTEVLFEYNQVK